MKIEKGYKDKKILVCVIGEKENNYICACESTKEIWSCLQTAHEEIEQVKESKVDPLTSQYENITMKEGETIHEIITTFASIMNDL